MPFARKKIEHNRFSLERFSLDLTSACQRRHHRPSCTSMDTSSLGIFWSNRHRSVCKSDATSINDWKPPFKSCWRY